MFIKLNLCEAICYHNNACYTLRFLHSCLPELENDLKEVEMSFSTTFFFIADFLLPKLIFIEETS